MNRCIFPTGGRVALLTLILASSMAPSYAARKHSAARSPVDARQRVRLNMGYGAPTGVVTPSTDPKMLLSPQEWRRYVRTELPRFDKVDPGPFAVWQNWRFERGETRVPPSTNTF